MFKIFTIGFTEKSAEFFFSLLKKSGTKGILDIRLNTGSQLAGFAKGGDLKYFSKEICGITYEHDIDLAPTKNLLSQYRNNEITWGEYVKQYINILNDRKIASILDKDKINGICLLCSENLPDKCHRRLLAEYIKNIFKDVEIIHLY